MSPSGDGSGVEKRLEKTELDGGSPRNCRGPSWSELRPQPVTVFPLRFVLAPQGMSLKRLNRGTVVRSATLRLVAHGMLAGRFYNHFITTCQFPSSARAIRCGINTSARMPGQNSFPHSSTMTAPAPNSILPLANRRSIGDASKLKNMLQEISRIRSTPSCQ
jgi:hypothetical protein